MSNPKVTYKVIRAENEAWFDIKIDAAKLEERLNKLGDEGWDLVNSFDLNHSISSGGGGGTKEVIMIFKKYDDLV